ncbi:2-heptaprenyl-1,4-naphthoquinone methyltransferase [Geomicrobium sp. JCM 19039]|nr:2-heptaprenyl-1,4-naphthoquinone methyltransferase [Geomicrobium sp. JCM 19039]
MELLHGDATELPFADESFHVVTIGFGLRNVPDPKKALQEILRVLKPGGQVLCLETSHPENVLFKPFYSVYFKQVMPRLGRWVAGSGKEYQWLYDSTATFPKKKELAEWFVDSGFVDVNYRSYAGGAAAGHWGFKRSVLRMQSMNKLKTILEMIKFEHTVFALPFAFLGAILGSFC